MAEFYERNDRLYRDKTAFCFDDGRRFTFGEHADRVAALNAALDEWGVGRGGRLAVLAPIGVELVDWLGVAAATGRVIIPLNWRLSSREIRMVLRDARPDVFVCHSDFEALGRDAVSDLEPPSREDVPGRKGYTPICVGVGMLGFSVHDHERLAADRTDWELKRDTLALRMRATEPGDPPLVIYTSGTTGTPKGVVLDQGGQAANSVTVITEMALRDTDSFYTCLPMFHIGATSMVFNFFARGCTNHLEKRWDTDAFLTALEREKVTCTVLVPSLVPRVLDRLAETNYDISSLRTLYYSGAPMPEPDIRRAAAVLGNVLYQAYGSTETGPSICALHKEDHVLTGENQDRLKSCGRPVADVMVEIRNDNGTATAQGDVGVVCVRSRAIMVAYLGNEEATAQSVRDGWLQTGDLARRDADGYVYLVGRKKDLVISGGENVFPGEVEACIRMMDSVDDVAVVGMPDATWGEMVAAMVVPKSGVSLTADEVLDFCRREIAGYKKPRLVMVADELPRNVVGKVDKNRIRAIMAGR